jgi:hypothetical protein
VARFRGGPEGIVWALHFHDGECWREWPDPESQGADPLTLIRMQRDRRAQSESRQPPAAIDPQAPQELRWLLEEIAQLDRHDLAEVADWHFVDCRTMREVNVLSWLRTR